MLTPNLEAANAHDAAQAEENVAPVETTTEQPPASGGEETTTTEASPSEAVSTGEGGEKQNEEGGAELSDLLADTGVTSIDELKDLIDSDKSLKELLGDKKLEDVLEKAGKLDEHEATWAKEDEAKLRSEEEPEETIARLDQQLADGKQATADKAKATRTTAEAQKAIDAYDGNVDAFVDASDLPDSHKDLMKHLLNSSTPTSMVDIGNKADVRNMTKELQVKLKAFSDGVIQDYIDGKSAVPKVSPSTPAASEDGKGKPLNSIKDATKAMIAKIPKKG